MLSEVAPPGFGHTKGDKEKGVKKGGTAAAFDKARKEGRFKGSKSDMFAIMWAMKKKGAKPQYKPGTNKKYKKYREEETSYKQRDVELKKTSAARNERYKTLHKKTGKGNVDVNENVEVTGGFEFQDYDPNMKFREYEFHVSSNEKFNCCLDANYVWKEGFAFSRNVPNECKKYMNWNE